jgi:lipoprotein-anchoring transpeptidase ErfK/SrfK
MDKARSTVAKLIASCVATSLLYPTPTDMKSQARNAPMDRPLDNPSDRPISAPVQDLAGLFAPPQYALLIPDPPPALAPTAKRRRQASKPAAPKARVVIQIDQTDQRLSVQVGGEIVPELASVLVSTGRPGNATRTPDGLYSPRTMAVRRPSYFASRLLNRPVYLTHTIQIVDGIFMHDASHEAMEHLGQKRSYGCVRVDRRRMPTIFRLVKQHRADTRIQIFHSLNDEARRSPVITSQSEIQETR